MSSCFVDDDGETRCGSCTLQHLFDDVPPGVATMDEVPEEVLEAAVVGKEPVFQVEFQGTGRTDSYAVIPWWMFLALTTGGAES